MTVIQTTETSTGSELLALGRKVELADVTPRLVKDAEAWLLAWSGNFDFLQSVKASLVRKGQLSPAQAKGVLNCWRADLERQAKRAASQASSNDHSEQGEVLPGIYVKGDGSIWKVQESKERPGNFYAKVWVGINGERLTLAGAKVSGEWQYERGSIYHLRGAAHLNLEQAKQFILLYGKCVRCGRTLKAAASVERGIGPICIEYFEGWGS